MAQTKGTLKYRKIQRTPQTGENAGKKKWYATAVNDRVVTFEDFISHISDHGSPYSRGCIHGVLMDSLDHLQELILDGKSVRLGDLGLFSIGMTSKAEDTKDKVNAQSIQGVHLIVRNTKTWSNAELSKKCKLQEYGSFDTTGSDNGGGNSDGGNDNPGGGQAGDKGDNQGTQGDKGDSKGDTPTNPSQGGGSSTDSGGSTSGDGNIDYN